MDPHTWPCKSKTTSTNIHSAAMWEVRDVVLKTCLGWWTIGRSGERGSWISVLPARHDDDSIAVNDEKNGIWSPGTWFDWICLCRFFYWYFHYFHHYSVDNKLYIYIHIYIYIYKCVCIYIYIYIYTNAHMGLSTLAKELSAAASVRHKLFERIEHSGSR